MAKFKLRFYGRFVFAERFRRSDNGASPAGALDVLVVNMNFNPDVQADAHRFFITAPRRHVAANGTRRPDGIVMAAGEPITAEHAFWELPDHEVALDGENSFEWTNLVTATLPGPGAPPTRDEEIPITIPDLSELSGGTGVLDSASLFTRGAGSVTTAVMHLPAGRATLSQMAAEFFTFVKVSSPSSTGEKRYRLADIVDIEIDGPELLTFRVRHRSGGPVSAIVLNSLGGAEIPVTITNLCSRPHEQFDQEFAGLYDILNNPPLTRSRLVPKGDAPRLGGSFDCFKCAYLRHMV